MKSCKVNGQSAKPDEQKYCAWKISVENNLLDPRNNSVVARLGCEDCHGYTEGCDKFLQRYPRK